MYIGSVRFYKHLILLVIAIICISCITACVCMGISNRNMSKILEAHGLDPKGNAQSLEVNSDPAAIAREKMAQYYLTSFEYQRQYPNLMVDNDFQYIEDPEKSVFLTFDDGPSSLTSKVLDILKEKDVKATFFIVYNDSAEARALYQRMIDEGHTIGVHSTCHQYETIYQSPQAFLDDFAQTAFLIEQSTGVKPEIFRFPGGSINNYNKSVYQQIIAEMVRRGYTYFDWNVSADDSTATTGKKDIYQNVVSGVHRFNKSIVLMHDAGNKYDAIDALPGIIDDLKAEGYTFCSLNKDIRPVSFDYAE